MVADGFFGLCGSESRDELLMGTWYPPPPSHLPCPPSLISRMWLLWTLSNVKEEARNCQLVRELLQGGQKSPSSHLQEGILPTAVYRRPLFHQPVLCTGARSFISQCCVQAPAPLSGPAPLRHTGIQQAAEPVTTSRSSSLLCTTVQLVRHLPARECPYAVHAVSRKFSWSCI